MPNSNRMAALSLLALIATSCANASSTPQLDQWLKQAEGHSPRVAAAQAALDAAVAGARAAGAWPNPELGYGREDMGTPSPADTLELRQRLELGGKAGRRQQIAVAEEQKARLIKAQVVNDLRASVHRAYYDLSLAELRVQEAKNSARLAQDFSAALDKKLAAGRVPPIEAAKAKLPAILAAEELRNAESLHGIAIRRLEALVGQPVTDTEHAAPDLPKPPPTWDSVQERYPRQSPPLRIANAQIAIQLAELESQKAQRWPDLVISGGIKKTRGETTSSRQFGISLDIPIFGRPRDQIAMASAKLDQAKADLQSATLETELTLRTLHASLQSLSERIRLYQETVIPTAEGAYKTAQQGFDLGRYGFIDVLDAQRSLLSSRTERTNLWQQYIEQRAEFSRILGAIDANQPD